MFFGLAVGGSGMGVLGVSVGLVEGDSGMGVLGCGAR